MDQNRVLLKKEMEILFQLIPILPTQKVQMKYSKFGFGDVTHVDESGPDRKARITFGGLGEKTLLLSFAKLRIME